MNSPFLSFFSKSQILLEYSEPFINKFAIKLATSVNDATRVEEFKNYIRFFDTIRNTNVYQTYVKNNPNIFSRNNKPIADPKNIDLFNAAHLEHIFDEFNKEEKREEQQVITKDASLIWPEDVSTTIRDHISPTAAASNNDKYIEVYYAGNADACIKFTHDVFGQSYSFCIGRKMGHMYDTYRYQDTQNNNGYTGPRSFYFVRDYSRRESDPLHLIVVHAMQSGKFRFTNAPNNNSDAPVGDWEDLLKIQPKLHNLKDKIVFVPFSEKEQDYVALKYTDMWHLFQIAPRLRNAALSSGIVLPIHIFTQLSADEQNVYIASLTGHNKLVKLSRYEPAEADWNRRATFIMQNTVNMSKLLETAKNDTDLGIKPLAELLDVHSEYYTKYWGGLQGFSSFLSTLVVLSVNTKYYVNENGDCIPRKEKRSQPLKYFIQKDVIAGRTTISYNIADQLLDIPYQKKTEIANFGAKIKKTIAANEYSADHYTIINCGLNSLIIVNKNIITKNLNTRYEHYDNEHKPVCFVLNNETGKTAYTALSILGVSVNGFLVKEINSDSPNFLLKINKDSGELDTITKFDGNKIAEEDNYAGPLNFSDFKSVSLEMQQTLLLRRLKYAHNEMAAGNLHYLTNVTRNQIIDTEDKEYFKFVYPKITESAIFIIPFTDLRNLTQMLGDGFYNFAALYFICKDIGGEVFNYYKENIEPFYDRYMNYIQEMGAYKNCHEVVDNRMLILTRLRNVFLLDIKNYKIILSGITAILTKKQIIVMPEASVKGFEKAVGINKETLQLTSPDILQKVKTTIKEIYKLRKNEAADVLATTMIDYDLNGKLVADITKKTNIKNTVSVKYPLYSAKSYGMSVNSNCVIVNTQNNTDLQNKYLKLLNTDRDKNIKQLLLILNLANIELAQVIVKPSRDWITGMTVDVGFCFLKRGSNLKTFEDAKAAFNTNSLYFEVKQLYVLSKEHGYGPTKSRDSIFKEDSTSYTNINVNHVNIFMRSNSVFKAKKTKLNNLLGKLKNLKLLNDVCAFSPTLWPRDINKIFSENFNTNEKIEIPFKLFYKLLS